MSGLILKDFLILRKSLRIYALMLVIYLALALLGIMSLSFVMSMMTFITTLLPLSAFSWDELARWDRYAMSLPLGRRRVVGARYLTVLLMNLGCVAVGLLLCVADSIVNRGQPSETAAILVAALTSGLLVMALMLPPVYKLGHERAKPLLLAIIFLPILAFALAARFGLLQDIDLGWIDALSVPAALGLGFLFPCASLAGLLLSYLISCRVAERKEY